MLAIIQITLYLFGTYLETGRQEKTFFDTSTIVETFFRTQFFFKTKLLAVCWGFNNVLNCWRWCPRIQQNEIDLYLPSHLKVYDGKFKLFYLKNW